MGKLTRRMGPIMGWIISFSMIAARFLQFMLTMAVVCAFNVFMSRAVRYFLVADFVLVLIIILGLVVVRGKSLPFKTEMEGDWQESPLVTPGLVGEEQRVGEEPVLYSGEPPIEDPERGAFFGKVEG